LVDETYPNLIGFANARTTKPIRFTLAKLIGFYKIAQIQDFFFSKMQHLLNQICHYHEITANWNLNYT
jgi:hypothetical protein